MQELKPGFDLSKFRAKKITKPCCLWNLEGPMKSLSWVLGPRYKKLKPLYFRRAQFHVTFFSLEKLTSLVRPRSSERVDDGS